MALFIEYSPAVQEVPGSIPGWDTTFSDALWKGCRWLWSSLYSSSFKFSTSFRGIFADIESSQNGLVCLIVYEDHRFTIRPRSFLNKLRNAVKPVHEFGFRWYFEAVLCLYVVCWGGGGRGRGVSVNNSAVTEVSACSIFILKKHSKNAFIGMPIMVTYYQPPCPSCETEIFLLCCVYFL